jgi:hypothetical protein
VAPTVCVSSAWNLLDVTLLGPRIVKWLVHFWKICGPLVYTILSNRYRLILIKIQYDWIQKTKLQFVRVQSTTQITFKKLRIFHTSVSVDHLKTLYKMLQVTLYGFTHWGSLQRHKNSTNIPFQLVRSWRRDIYKHGQPTRRSHKTTFLPKLAKEGRLQISIHASCNYDPNQS